MSKQASLSYAEEVGQQTHNIAETESLPALFLSLHLLFLWHTDNSRVTLAIKSVTSKHPHNNLSVISNTRRHAEAAHKGPDEGSEWGLQPHLLLIDPFTHFPPGLMCFKGPFIIHNGSSRMFSSNNLCVALSVQSPGMRKKSCTSFHSFHSSQKCGKQPFVTSQRARVRLLS